MARRNDHTREELKDMATSYGHALISGEGLGAFSARRLAGEIGYSVGTLYNVFGNYDTMLLSINALTLAALSEELGEVAASARRPEMALRKMARAYLAFAQREYHAWTALFEHRMAEGAPVPAWYRAQLDAVFTLVEAPLGKLEGVSPHQAPLEARALWAGVHGVCILGLSGKLAVVGVPTKVASALELLLDRYLAGLGGRNAV